jgi:plasmid maintenance system antidote protein VapI
MAIRFEKAFVLHPDTLMRMQGVHDVAREGDGEAELSVK